MKSICFSSNSVVLEGSLSSGKTQILLALGPSCRMSSIYRQPPFVGCAWLTFLEPQ